jgi:Na+/H+ antiporter NhaD/arsenite permease-like protein
MELIIIVVFILGYLAIAFEHPLKINKTASALLTGVLCWTLFILSEPSENLLESEHFKSFALRAQMELGAKFNALSQSDLFHRFVTDSLQHHLSSIAEILFFLMGAMTIVELIDAHQGFRSITRRIRTQSPRKLMWIICLVTFFLSAVLDNLTTTIVMVSLIRKLVHNRDMRLLFIGMIVIAANAGGAWTPMGDVTTTMLWIGGQVSTFNIMKVLLLPSLVCLVVPLTYLTFKMKGYMKLTLDQSINDKSVETGRLMLILGLGVMLGVPVFKIVTHLPPYIGMMAGLGILWVVSELTDPNVDESLRKNYTAAAALSRIDVPSILFFFGILLAVSALESMMTLHHFSQYLASTIGDQRIIISLIGVLSAVVDNVPLVAACMGMYSLEVYPVDHFIWEFLAYCAGTGGSILIIGSAAGVAAMGMEKIDFIWYLKKISLLASLGYVAGGLVYLISQGGLKL